MTPVVFHFGGKFRKSAANPGARALGTSRLTANERAMTSVYTDAVRSLTADLDTSILSRALSVGSVGNAVQAFAWDKFGDRMSDARIPLLQQVRDTGKAEATALKNIVGSYAFNVTDPRATAWAGARSSELVVNISDQLRSEIRGLITSSFVNQIDPREIAREIPRAIGLFPRWAGAVENSYQRNLTDFLGQGMSRIDAEAKAGLLADAYRERLIDSRARMIARTEVMTAANQGRFISWQQAGDRGLIDLSTAYKEWIAEDDACDECSFADGEFALAEEVFESVGEDMPPAHPNCRCTAVLVPAEDVDPAVLEEQAAARAERNDEEDTTSVTPPDEDSTYPVEVTDLSGPATVDLTPVEEPVVEDQVNDYTPAAFGSDEISTRLEELVAPINEATGSGSKIDPILGDIAGSAFAELQGFNALPSLVSDEMLSSLVDQGWTEVFRGIAAGTEEQFATYADLFMTGETPYFGAGIYGNGTYASDAFEIAEGYAKGENIGIGGKVESGAGDVLRMAINPNAKVVDMDSLIASLNEQKQLDKVMEQEFKVLMEKAQSSYRETLDTLEAKAEELYRAQNPDAGYVAWYTSESMLTAEERATHEAASKFFHYGSEEWKSLLTPEMESLRARISAADFITEDYGRYAMSQGYDAIQVRNPFIGYDDAGQPVYATADHFNILNRGAIAVRRIS